MNETHLRAVFLMLAGESGAAVSEEFLQRELILSKITRKFTTVITRNDDS